MKLPTKTLILDVETDGLTDYKNIWCIVVYHEEDRELRVFDMMDGPDYLEKFKEYAKDATEFVMHNGVSYDRWVLKNLADFWIPLEKITDTVILSRLFDSGRFGGHSLERWGKMLRCQKIKNDVWDRWSPTIKKRCVVDVQITRRTWIVTGKRYR